MYNYLFSFFLTFSSLDLDTLDCAFLNNRVCYIFPADLSHGFVAQIVVPPLQLLVGKREKCVESVYR